MFAVSPLPWRNRHATTNHVQNLWKHCWKLGAFVPLTCACGSEGGSDMVHGTGTTVDGASTLTVTATQTSATGALSTTTAGATSGGSSTTTNAAVTGSGGNGAGGSGANAGSGGGAAGAAAEETSSTTGDLPDLTGTPTEEERAELPAVRQEHGAAALNGEVYVLGGFTPDASASVQAYDPEEDSWRDVADFPVVFHHPNVAVVAGKLYVAGFLFGSSLRDGDGRTFAYDPDADEWEQRASMPVGTDRGSACVATLDDDIYVFGGASEATMPDASMYDTLADEWTPLPPMPALREHCVAAGIGGKIYIVSGRANSIQGIQIESWVYDPVSQTYDERAAMPTPRAGGAGAVLAGRIFVFGGEGNDDDPEGVFHEIEAYDPVADSWEELPDMMTPRHGFAAASVGDRIYLPGGALSQGFGASDWNTVFYFDPED